MTEQHKPILCLDFDGVLHSYTSGWKGADVIPDPPVPGTLAFLYDASEYFEIYIFSSRSNQPGGLDAMKRWLTQVIGIGHEELTGRGRKMFQAIKWPTEKPPAMVTLDDRALTFTGEWPSIESLKEFKPWNKR